MIVYTYEDTFARNQYATIKISDKLGKKGISRYDTDYDNTNSNIGKNEDCKIEG